MLFWFLSVFFLVRGLNALFSDFDWGDPFFGGQRSRKKLIQVVSVLRDLEETLMTGLVPEARRWELLKKLEKPWGSLASESLGELRASGGALLPTLERLRGLAEEHGVALEDAQAKTAQSLVQSLICGLLVPLVGGVLYILLPAIQQNAKAWWLACGMALVLMLLGGGWMLRIAETARWGGLLTARRAWVLSSYCAGERLLAMVRLGVPPDLAWSRASHFLAGETPDLAQAWGSTVWEAPPVEVSGRAEGILIAAGHSIRKAIQVATLEGRPCLDRVEASLRGLRLSIKSQVDRELSLVGTQALKPLFLCIAPAILGLLFFALWLAGVDSLGGSEGAGFAAF